MKGIVHIFLLGILAIGSMMPLTGHANVFLDIFGFLGGGGGAGCSYDGDVRNSFKNCDPTAGLAVKPNVDLDVEARKDFRIIVANITKRFQILASILAIGGLVFVGLLLVSPVKEETKSSAKKGFIYATLGFFIAIIASVIVNAIVDVMYDIFG